MTDPTDLTDEDQRLGSAVVAAIDVLTDVVVELAIKVEGDDESEAPSTALVIAEGVLARILGAFVRAHENHTREHLAEVLLLSNRHVDTLAHHYWDRLEAKQAARDADAASDA